MHNICNSSEPNNYPSLKMKISEELCSWMTRLHQRILYFIELKTSRAKYFKRLHWSCFFLFFLPEFKFFVPFNRRIVVFFAPLVGWKDLSAPMENWIILHGYRFILVFKMNWIGNKFGHKTKVKSEFTIVVITNLAFSFIKANAMQPIKMQIVLCNNLV